jgi:hypothetical protein
VDEARRYLDRADRAWSVAQERRGDLYGIAWRGETLHRAFRANTAVLSGQPAEAVPLLEHVVAGSTGSNRVAALSDLAAALARLGEVDEAAEMLLVAYMQTRGHDRARRIRGIRQRDLAGHDTVPAVRRLDEVIAAG